MLEIETTVEMMIDMSGIGWERQPDKDNDLTYRFVHKNVIYFAVFNTEYGSVNVHEVNCVDVNVPSPDLLYCRPVISIVATDMCERFNNAVEFIKNVIQ